MPRQRSPNRDKAKAMYINSKGKMQLKEIATQLDVNDTQVRKWKSQDKWDEELKGNVTIPKRNVTNQDKGIEEHSKIELLPEEIETLSNDELTEEQRLFCLYYSKSFNATSAYMKAYDSNYQASMANGCRLLRNDKIKEEIMKLKKERCARSLLTKEDIFQKYMDIAFADITDFLEFGSDQIDADSGDVIRKNFVHFRNHTTVDGTLIGEVKQGKDGASIKLPDRMRALQWLSDHMGWATELQQAQLAQIQAQTKKLETDSNSLDNEESVVIVNDIKEIKENSKTE